MKTLLAVFAVCVNFAAAEVHPPKWAATVAIDGLPNLHKVSDSLYRCAQPTEAGMENAGKLGIRTVLSLRAFHSDRTAMRRTAMGYDRISFKTWHPEEEDVVRFLKIVTDPARTPVLVHCQHGADRTGTMSAIYRIVVQGWTKEDAVAEMTGGGFGFHPIWKNLPPWIMALDVNALRAKAGLKPLKVPRQKRK